MFRWLGVAGIELTLGQEVLAIDPFFSRFPLRKVWFGHVSPDRELVAAKMPRCDFVLVTHAHWDHLLDVPEVVRNTEALALGSANTCRLLSLLGVPGQRVRRIRAGEQLSLGGFGVRVLPNEHGTVLGRTILDGPVRAGLQPPLRARDYRSDFCFGFLVEADGCRLLRWGSDLAERAPTADVLFIGVHGPPESLKPLLEAVRPRLVVPIHWDDFFRPLSEPLRPILAPPQLAVPPVRRMDLERFRQTVEGLAPGVNVLVPRIFQAYNMAEVGWRL